MGKTDPQDMDDDKKRETVENYLAFKTLMFKIEKDEDEYDDDGNIIPQVLLSPLLLLLLLQDTHVNAKELQNLGMPTTRGNPQPQTNGFAPPPLGPTALQPENLPPAMRGGSLLLLGLLLLVVGVSLLL